MDNLHTVLRAIRGETKATRNHLGVFREFLAHLDKISRNGPPRTSASPSRKRTPARKTKR